MTGLVALALVGDTSQRDSTCKERSPLDGKIFQSEGPGIIDCDPYFTRMPFVYVSKHEDGPEFPVSCTVIGGDALFILVKFDSKCYIDRASTHTYTTYIRKCVEKTKQ